MHFDLAQLIRDKELIQIISNLIEKSSIDESTKNELAYLLECMAKGYFA